MSVTADTPLVERLAAAVRVVAGDIGERHVWLPGRLDAAAQFVEAGLQACGYAVTRQAVEAEGRTVYNLEAELVGAESPGEVVVLGAHYDTFCGTHRSGGKGRYPGATGTPGANDNGSGVAALLALARAFADRPRPRTVRFVAFVNEEPPFYGTPQMGSRAYARRCRDRGEAVVGMVSLETLGYYSDAPGSQGYPVPLAGRALGSRGDFLAFLGNRGSRRLVRRARAAFARAGRLPARGYAVPVPFGLGWSDDWAFWEAGYEACSATDTAYLRYPHYHTPQDTPDKLDYPRFALAVEGLVGVVEDLAAAGPGGGGRAG